MYLAWSKDVFFWSKDVFGHLNFLGIIMFFYYWSISDFEMYPVKRSVLDIL